MVEREMASDEVVRRKFNNKELVCNKAEKERN
jgi:hypothetical protein